MKLRYKQYRNLFFQLVDTTYRVYGVLADAPAPRIINLALYSYLKHNSIYIIFDEYGDLHCDNILARSEYYTLTYDFYHPA